jgi:hypothetical protein
MCPGLERFIVSIKQDTMQTIASIAKRRLRIKPNLLSSEQIMIRTVLNKNVGFNDSDKHFGPVLYSWDLCLEQCQRHLFDGKGTYEYTERPKDMILEDVTRRLETCCMTASERNSQQNPLHRYSRNGQMTSYP